MSNVQPPDEGQSVVETGKQQSGADLTGKRPLVVAPGASHPGRQRRRGMGRVILELIRPGVLLPVLIGAAVLLGLLAFGDVSGIVALASTFQRLYLLYFLILTLGYEAMRLAVWHYLLGALGIRVPVRTQVFTFTAGEVTRDLPIGNYVPDYLLQQSQGTDFGFASSASLMITLMEVAVCLAGIVIIGIDDWTWLRPLVLVGTFVFLLIAWTLYRWYHLSDKHHPHPRLQWVLRRRFVRVALEEVRQFVRGEATLLHPGVLGIAATIVGIYLVLGGTGIYVVTQGLHLAQLTWPQALAVYFFSIAFAAIVPLPMDFGSVELSGTGALVAMSISRTAAVSIVLVNRVLSFGATLVIAAVVGLVLNKELRAMLRARRTGPKPDQQAQSTEANRQP